MKILGISAFYHDSAAALVLDGQIVAAAQEERFTRKKHDHAFPTRAIAYCLAEAGVSPGVAAVAQGKAASAVGHERRPPGPVQGPIRFYRPSRIARGQRLLSVAI